MAVPSIGSRGYDGRVVDELAWARMARYNGRTYSVGGPSHLRVSTVAGADRTVRIEAGEAWGQGVLDDFETSTIGLPNPGSGTRWHLLAVRRDWQPPAGVSVIDYLPGATDQAIPPSRLNDPGVEDDQPIALVQVSATSTTPTAIIDLRAWAGNGGIRVAHPLALRYLTSVGAVVHVGRPGEHVVYDAEWRCVVDAAGNAVWQALDRPWAAYNARTTTTPGGVDSYSGASGWASIVGATFPAAPPGAYLITPSLVLGHQSAPTPGTVRVLVNEQVIGEAPLHVDQVIRQFSPTFHYNHVSSGASDLRIVVQHRVEGGNSNVYADGTGVRTFYLGS